MKYLNYLASLVLILAFLLILYIGMLLFQPFTPPSLAPNIIPILNKDHKIHHGETISTEINYCIYQKVPSTTTRKYQTIGGDERIYFLSTTESVGQAPKCGHVVSNTFPVANDVPIGKYKIVLTSTFRVNVLKSVTVQYETEPFEIIQ